MSTLHTGFHTELARMFVDDVFYKRSRYYYFLGKIAPWNVIEQFEPGTSQTQKDKEELLSNVLFVKQIESNQVSLTAKLIQWEENKIFEKWDHTKEMKGKDFYCLNSEFKVYKCLDNFGGAPSTEEPTGNSVYPFRTSDGYFWKYMYGITNFKQKRFVSINDMPIQRALSDAFYNNGSVESVSILDEGSGYADVQNTFIHVTGGTTTGSGAAAVVSLVGDKGEIVTITVTDPGSDYYKGAKISVDSTNGFGASLSIVADGVTGEITNINIGEAGYGYEVGDSIDITVGGGVFMPHVSRETGSIVEVSVVNPGYGYIDAPNLSVVGTTENPGTGKYDGNATALLTAVLGNEGSIESVAILDPGIDYPTDTSTTITVQGDGINAVFTPVVHGGKVIGIITENPGENYTNIILHVVGAGTEAELLANIGASDFISDQSIIEQTSVPGAIHAVEVVTSGSGYSQETTATVVGDGEDCIVDLVIDDGEIKRIEILNPGKNYSFAEIFLTDPGGEGKEALFYVILPPPNGHGYDAPSELFADGVVISTSLRNELEDINIEQDFRQYGIIQNPRNIFDESLFDQDYELVTFKVKFNHVDDLIKDEILLLNNYRFKVVEFNSDTNTVWLQSKNLVQVTPIGTFYAESDILREYDLEQILSSPTIDKYSGTLFYSNNEPPFMFLEEQGITIRTFIKF